MEAKELKSEADASQGTPRHQRVKLKPASRTQSHGQLGVVSESHLVKCSRNDRKKKKKKKEEKKKHVSRLQTGTDASEAVLADCHQVKRERVGEESFSWMQSDGQMGVGSGSHLVKCKRTKKKHASREAEGTSKQKRASRTRSNGHPKSHTVNINKKKQQQQQQQHRLPRAIDAAQQ